MGKFRSRAKARRTRRTKYGRTRRTKYGSKLSKEKVIGSTRLSSVVAANPSDFVTDKLDGDSCGFTAIARKQVKGDVYAEVAKKRKHGMILRSCTQKSLVSYTN